MKNGDFTKRKFLDFPIERQHKKCAELLRIAYEKRALNLETTVEEIEAYHMLIKWMGYERFNLETTISRLKLETCKTIADTYHFHAQLASIKHKEHYLLPKIRQGDRQKAEPSWNISIYLDNIRSAHNVGSILRTVEALSLGNVHFSDTTPTPSNKQVKDAAMGAEQWVNCFTNARLETLPRPVIVMETSDSAMPIFDFPFPEAFTLVIGNEEYGCSENILKLAETLIEIPLRGHKNSLNVANAFAIVAGEIARQKKTLH